MFFWLGFFFCYFYFFFVFLFCVFFFFFFFFQAEDGIRDLTVTGVQTCALPIWVWCRSGPRTSRSGFRTSTKAEGIEGKPAFREAFQRRRCPVPVDSF